MYLLIELDYLQSTLMKVFIISNRLPFKIVKKDNKFSIERSEGGLATGLGSLGDLFEKHWIGWPGIFIEKESDKLEVTAELEKMNIHPVFLTKEQIKNYYEGFSNSTLWPLCHYFFVYTLHQDIYWQAYKEANRLFHDEAIRLITSDDIVWVHDYQLMLLPDMIRKALPNATIGYFHHIPFPSYELFRILPQSAEILKGLLGADFIAFHTHSYMRHFINSIERVLHIDFTWDEAHFSNRVVRVNALPMGINYQVFHDTSLNENTQKNIDKINRHYKGRKLIFSVDRLDYSKGILQRLSAFSAFLEHHPEYHGKVIFIMQVIPSRDCVDSYCKLKEIINEGVSAINGRYSTLNWVPIHYLYHSLTFPQLSAMYYLADIMMVNSLRDGMNLVAKEYIATKRGNKGVLILSELTGSAAELTQALLVNPNDLKQVETSLLESLEMPIDEQLSRICEMQKVLSKQTVNKWADDFITELLEVHQKSQNVGLKLISSNTLQIIAEKYQSAEKRLIVLDYDGTLVAIKKRPEEAEPSQELISLLRTLCLDPGNRIVINSGRDSKTLDSWLGALPVSMAAEHGAFYKNDGVWHNNLDTICWDDKLLDLLNKFVDRTPGSHLEIKDTALAWHYREVDSWLGTLRSEQLEKSLLPMCLQQNLQILHGNKVVEVKSADCTKGTEVKRLLETDSYDFILAMGDDTTDEDMFCALPSDAVSIKVGSASSFADYNLAYQSDVLPFLQHLISSNVK